MLLSEKVDFFRCTLWTSSLEAIHKRSNLQSIYIFFLFALHHHPIVLRTGMDEDGLYSSPWEKKNIQTFQQHTQYVPVYWPWNGKDAFNITGNKKCTWALTFLVILLYSSLASLPLIFSRRATSSGFWSERKKSQWYNMWIQCNSKGCAWVYITKRAGIYLP